MSVGGVGQGHRTCTHNCTLPIAVLSEEGQHLTGAYDPPTVPGSSLPALLGLNACIYSRMRIDAATNTIYMSAPGECDLQSIMPLDTQCFQGVLAPPGHFMFPCAMFKHHRRMAERSGWSACSSRYPSRSRLTE